MMLKHAAPEGMQQTAYDIVLGATQKNSEQEICQGSALGLEHQSCWRR